jgi:hypothetical protein
MPLQRTETFAGTGNTVSWNCDPSIVPFNLNVACAVLGTATYKLQYSYDSLDAPTATDASATWYDSVEIPAGTIVSAAQQFTAPIYRIRLVIAANAGGIKMTMLQGMSTN